MWSDQAVNVDAMVEDTRVEVRERALKQNLDPARELDIDLVRVVPPMQWGEVFTQCVRDQGFEAEVVEGGMGVEFATELPSEQIEPFNYALYRCDMQYVMHPLHSTVPPREAVAVLYDFQVAETLPCVREHGYETEDPPSKDTWVEAYLQQQAVWSPWDAPRADVVNASRREQTLEECPAFPDWFYPGV